MKIADHEIGPGLPVFLQAELGVTTMGDVPRTLELIDACAAAGLDACKFIVTNPLKVESRPERYFAYETMKGRDARPIGDLLAETMFAFEDWRKIRDHCHARGLVFFATADHLDAVDLLQELEAPAFKICAWDIAFMPLIERIRETRKPYLVDVSTATRAEVLRAIPDDPNVLFVHSPHPSGLRDWNMSRLVHFFRADYPIGFASPGREDWCDFLALGGGACLIEKRLTLKRDESRGHHHAISLEPDELKAWARLIRFADAVRSEDPFEGTAEAWAERKRNDRTANGLRP